MEQKKYTKKDEEDLVEVGSYWEKGDYKRIYFNEFGNTFFDLSDDKWKFDDVSENKVFEYITKKLEELKKEKEPKEEVFDSNDAAFAEKRLKLLDTEEWILFKKLHSEFLNDFLEIIKIKEGNDEHIILKALLEVIPNLNIKTLKLTYTSSENKEKNYVDWFSSPKPWLDSDRWVNKARTPYDWIIAYKFNSTITDFRREIQGKFFHGFIKNYEKLVAYCEKNKKYKSYLKLISEKDEYQNDEFSKKFYEYLIK